MRVAGALLAVTFGLPFGMNPQPVHLVRPPHAPLSAVARLGHAVFFDASLSGSGRLSCASCHSPAHAYGPPGSLSVMRDGLRAVPSLMYLERQPPFTIGPDGGEADVATPVPVTAAQIAHAAKVAQLAPSTPAVVPQGGLFWDGRADTLQAQATGPLFDPHEMNAQSTARVAERLRAAPYASAFRQLFGAEVLHDARGLLAEAMFAVARYQIEAPSFHPYSSKYDAWLEGHARFTPAEMRGYRAFTDPHGANCAACHLAQPTADGLPPLFTDHQFEALAVPRNPAILANRNAAFHDLGLCGPVRRDLRRARADCGLFATPTLRNVATRHAFFHNGVYHTLAGVLDFYNLRDVQPARVYPRDRSGRIRRYDDLPAADVANIDRSDAPLNRTVGEKPTMTPAQERDIIAFLRTLTDGYTPDWAHAWPRRNAGRIAPRPAGIGASAYVNQGRPHDR
jgi:cytochrome c peroxidase